MKPSVGEALEHKCDLCNNHAAGGMRFSDERWQVPHYYCIIHEAAIKEPHKRKEETNEREP